ncbi:MAG: NUDIX domain-containing protein [Nitrospira sp.]|nr:NUDIX domain-containing protein [Nitrospira sp.]
MKSNLQIRAERSAEQFADKARKPLVIEFAGVPKAGKTSTLTHVQTFLKRCGFRTDVVVERASVCPIRDKKHANFNIWTACTTLAQILEKTQNPPRPDDPQILFLDRGIFDSICWMTMMERISRIRRDERELIQKFLLIDDWKKRISAVFVMLVSPSDAMKREQGVLPVEGTGGSIMNSEILQQIKEINEECVDQLGKDFRIFSVNTSDGETKENPERTAEVVAEAILGLIEAQLEENILSCSKKVVTKFFGEKNFIDASQAEKLARYFREDHESNFRPRDAVENDESRVQALPIVVIRNADGEVLRLRRREKTVDNILHDKIVIWAGGHVRCEDAVNGDPLTRCAVREIEEELRLQIEPASLRSIGAVYFDNGGSTSKHVGIAYEWRASTNDVSVVLSRTEFFEKRGTSLSGSFASVDQLAKDVGNNKLAEPWSVELIREYLAKDTFDSNPRLL